MATGDFWKRVVGEGIGDGTPINQGKIPVHVARALLLDVAIGSGGISLAQARTLLRLEAATTALQEFNDLADSVATITNANTDVQRGRRMVVVEALAGGAFIAERGTKVGGGVNPYATGEALRLRVKALISAMPGATLIGSMAV